MAVPGLAYLADKLAGGLVSYLVRTGADRSLKYLDGKKKKQALVDVVQAALDRFEEIHPQLARSFFDETFVQSHAMEELSKLLALSTEEEPDPIRLAEGFGKYFKEPVPGIEEACADFVRLFDQRLRAAPEFVELISHRLTRKTAQDVGELLKGQQKILSKLPGGTDLPGPQEEPQRPPKAFKLKLEQERDDNRNLLGVVLYGGLPEADLIALEVFNAINAGERVVFEVTHAEADALEELRAAAETNPNPTAADRRNLAGINYRLQDLRNDAVMLEKRLEILFHPLLMRQVPELSSEYADRIVGLVAYLRTRSGWSDSPPTVQVFHRNANNYPKMRKSSQAPIATSDWTRCKSTCGKRAKAGAWELDKSISSIFSRGCGIDIAFPS
jgi:hypothetical protein